MSYCMFENTCDDLKACVERLEEDGRAVLEESSKYEVRAMASMYDLCKRYMELMEEQYENWESFLFRIGLFYNSIQLFAPYKSMTYAKCLIFLEI